MAIDKKLICFARLEEFERQLAAGNILDKSIVFIQDANKIYNRGTYYDCQSPYVLPFDIETLDGLSYSDNEGRLQTDADVFEKAKSAIEMGRMVVIRYGLSDAGYHICDATYNGDAISVRVYNGLMLYSFEIYASSQGSIVVEQYSLQSELVDGVNIATINGQSLTEGGDLTIESGTKIYEWFYDGESESVTLSQEEYDNITEADIVVVNFGGIWSSIVNKTSKEFSEAAGNYALVGQLEMEGVKLYININIKISTKLAKITLEQQEIPTKTSQLENDSNFITSEDVAAVALSGSYNDLQDTPTIPSAVTESTVSGWGFTKNTGTYSKPSGGIPKSDLASAVQTSLGKADTALQSYTVQYKGTVTGVKINGTTKNPSSGVVDLGTVITAHQTLKTINGESIVGSGDITIQGGGVSSYTTNFTYRELYEVAFSEGQSIECNVQLIEDALRNNIPVFVPIDTDPSYYGYAVLEGYAEDLLYFSVKTANEIIGVEISRTASEIRSEDINKKGVIATVEESVSKEIVGDLEVANTQALHGGGSVYALPDQANGDEDDILLSRNSVKTINGESILGSGDIEIVGGGGGSSSGKEIVEVIVDGGSISFTGMGGKPSFEPNKIYYGTTPVIESVSIFSVIPPTEDIGEYSLHFSYDNLNSVYFDAPSDWLWSNGIPTVESGVSYELSVVATKFGDDYIYKAVLTPFKAVE